MYSLREDSTDVGASRDAAGAVASAFFSAEDAIEARVTAWGQTAAGLSKAVSFAIVGVSQPAAVAIQSAPGSECAHRYDERSVTLVVSCKSIELGLIVSVSGVQPKYI